MVAAYGAPGILVALLTGPYSDRLGRKRFLVAGSLIMGTLTLLSAFATSFAVLIGARFASNTTLLTEQVPEARGTLLALSASVTSASIVAGATIGGLIIDGPGFWALGVFCFAAAVLAASVVTIFVREEPIDLEIAPAG